MYKKIKRDALNVEKWLGFASVFWNKKINN